jgi:hypothetical protein
MKRPKIAKMRSATQNRQTKKSARTQTEVNKPKKSIPKMDTPKKEGIVRTLLFQKQKKTHTPKRKATQPQPESELENFRLSPTLSHSCPRKSVGPHWHISSHFFAKLPSPPQQLIKSYPFWFFGPSTTLLSHISPQTRCVCCLTSNYMFSDRFFQFLTPL